LLGPVVAAAQAAYFQQIVLISAFALNHNEQAPTLREHNAIYLAAGDGKTAPRRLDFTASSRTQPLRKARSLVTRRPGKELMDRVLQPDQRRPTSWSRPPLTFASVVQLHGFVQPVENDFVFVR
jgi:hypothetical protein